MDKKKALIISAGSGTVLLLAIIIVFFVTQNNSNTANNTTSNSTQAEVVSETISDEIDTSANSKYRNGVYVATGSYRSPAGEDLIEVKLDINDDTITAVDINPLSEDPVSKKYQITFKDNISGEVVGKKLDNAEVGKISGSSLTGIGFNFALKSIQNKAK